jgi:hypothetical protein
MDMMDLIPWNNRLDWAKKASRSSFKPSSWSVGAERPVKREAILTGRVQEDLRYRSSHEYFLQKKHAETCVARSPHRNNTLRDCYSQTITRVNAGPVLGNEQREVTHHQAVQRTIEPCESDSPRRLKLRRLQEEVAQGMKWRNDLFDRMNKERNARRVQPITKLGHSETSERSEADAALIIDDKCSSPDLDASYIAANDPSADESMSDPSDGTQSPYCPEQSDGESSISSERYSFEAGDADRCNPSDGCQLSEEMAAHDESKQLMVDSGIVEVDEASKSVSSGDIATIDEMHTGNTMDGSSCVVQSSKDDDVMNCCNRRKLNKRKKMARQAESEQAKVGQVVVEDMEASQAMFGNVAAVTGDLQHGETTGDSSYNSRSLEEDKRGQWYEERYMHEIKNLPKKRRRKQTSAPAGTLSWKDVQHHLG